MIKKAKKKGIQASKKIEDQEAGQSKEQEYLEGWKRSQADYQNLQKETQKKLASIEKHCKQEIIEQLLPILNHFEQAAEFVSEEQKQADWVKGLFLVQSQLKELLTKWGVEEIEVLGKPFDPHTSEAIGQGKGDQESGVVIKVCSPGYKVGSRVIVPAKVIVNE